MSDEQLPPAQRAQELAQQLRDRGHAKEADHIEGTLALHTATPDVQPPGHGFMLALRDALQTILTAIEAIDPVSITAIDDLRLEVDKHLIPHGEGHPPASDAR